jgi:SAM-dependent methyltransferase
LARRQFGAVEGDRLEALGDQGCAVASEPCLIRVSFGIVREWAENKGWGFLPGRYFEDWRQPLHEMAAPFLSPGGRVLDFGGGANPIIAPGDRPADLHYAGIDVSRHELEVAPPGSYDEMVVGDIADGILADESFDLVVSWQVLEHVHDMKVTLDGIHKALKPDGALVAQLSGSRAFFAILNRYVPDRVGEAAMQKLLGRAPESVFRAPYDRCTKSALKGITTDWRSVEIVSRYCGATYLGFSPVATRAYLVYENWLARRGAENFATHYLMLLMK